MKYWMGFIAAIFAVAAHGNTDINIEGNWYTEGVENGIAAQFIQQYKTDGSFIKKIRDNTNCSAPHQWTESGSWKFDGKELLEITEKTEDGVVDSSSPEFNDMFDIVRVDSEHLIMHDLKTKIDWTLLKVPASFTFPVSSHCNI